MLVSGKELVRNRSCSSSKRIGDAEPKSFTEDSKFAMACCKSLKMKKQQFPTTVPGAETEETSWAVKRERRTLRPGKEHACSHWKRIELRRKLSTWWPSVEYHAKTRVHSHSKWVECWSQWHNPHLSNSAETTKTIAFWAEPPTVTRSLLRTRVSTMFRDITQGNLERDRRQLQCT